MLPFSSRRKNFSKKFWSISSRKSTVVRLILRGTISGNFPENSDPGLRNPGLFP
jgi:hypothetical protein